MQPDFDDFDHLDLDTGLELAEDVLANDLGMLDTEGALDLDYFGFESDVC
jgi:hypothetical protein